jgi:Septum formation
VLGGVAVLLLVVAGVIVARQGDDDGSTVTAKRDTPTTESPSTTTTTESPGTTKTGAVVFVGDLRLGDCFNESNFGDPARYEVGEITVVDCGSPHDGEVFAVATLPGGPAAPYPGDDEVERQTIELCLGEFAPYVGIEYADSIWEVNWYVPSEASWRKYDDRLVVCHLGDPDFNEVEGSKRNSNT